MKMLSYSSSLSVILSVRRADISAIQATVKALAAQTLPSWAWKLIVIDERKDRSRDLAELFRWHPKVRLIADDSENNLPPSARAILGIKSDLALFLDGNSALSPNYLAKALEIAKANPLVGIFGGNVTIKVTGKLPQWKAPFLRYFGARKTADVEIHYEPKRSRLPAATGYVVHREHLRRFSNILMRHSLFRDHEFPPFAGNFDYRAALARSIAQSGSGIGLFPELRLQKTISHDDLKATKLKERVRTDAFSAVLERFIWTGSLPPLPKRRSWEQLAEQWLSFWSFDAFAKYRRAHRIGQFEATRFALRHCNRRIATRIPVTAKSAAAKTAPATA